MIYSISKFDGNDAKASSLFFDGKGTAKKRSVQYSKVMILQHGNLTR